MTSTTTTHPRIAAAIVRLRDAEALHAEWVNDDTRKAVNEAAADLAAIRRQVAAL